MWNEFLNMGVKDEKHVGYDLDNIAGSRAQHPILSPPLQALRCIYYILMYIFYVKQNQYFFNVYVKVAK